MESACYLLWLSGDVILIFRRVSRCFFLSVNVLYYPNPDVALISHENFCILISNRIKRKSNCFRLKMVLRS